MLRLVEELLSSGGTMTTHTHSRLDSTTATYRRRQTLLLPSGTQGKSVLGTLPRLGSQPTPFRVGQVSACGSSHMGMSYDRESPFLRTAYFDTIHAIRTVHGSHYFLHHCIRKGAHD